MSLKSLIIDSKGMCSTERSSLEWVSGVKASTPLLKLLSFLLQKATKEEVYFVLCQKEAEGELS